MITILILFFSPDFTLKWSWGEGKFFSIFFSGLFWAVFNTDKKITILSIDWNFKQKTNDNL